MNHQTSENDRTGAPRDQNPPNPEDAVTGAAADAAVDRASWKQAVARHRGRSIPRSWGQILSSVVPYLALWAAMIWTIGISFWLTLPLAIVAAGFMVRIFIIFHDCVHNSFFASRRANAILGFITGVLTFTPFGPWRREHVSHHGTAGNLDRRGIGDVWTLTVQEYLSATRLERFSYRLTRNPIILFVIAPLYLFLVRQRIPSSKSSRSEAWQVHGTNAALVAIFTGLWLTIGPLNLILIQLPILMVAGSAGVWLFYVQHQFDGVYWERRDDWSFEDAALQGSSYYKLPRVLQWFTGNIGFHHIHHLSPDIPNYNLERCHLETPMFRDVKPLTIRGSLKSLGCRLWDEESKALVGYRHLRRLRKGQQAIPGSGAEA